MNENHCCRDLLHIVRGAALGGITAAVVLLILLFAAALFSGRYDLLLDHRAAVSKAALMAAAVMAGAISARRALRRKIFHALAGEGVLMIFCFAVWAALGFQNKPGSMLTNIGLMLIGAFAGTILCGKRRKQRRGMGYNNA